MTTTTAVLPHTTLVGGGTTATTTTTTTTNGSSTMHTNRPLNTSNPVRSTSTITSTTTTSQTTTTTTSPRVLAQQAVQWYRDELDPTETHQTNVTSLFRPVVLSLTHFILQQQQQQQQTSCSNHQDEPETAETNGGASNPLKDWTDYLPIALRHVQGPSGSSPSSLPSPVSVTPEKTPFGTVTTSSSVDKSPFHSAATPSSSTTTTLSSSLPVLSARHVARMEAFLTGIVLAVPSSSSHDQPKRAPPAPQRFPKPLHKQQAPLQRAQSTATPSTSSTTFSLLDGLAGFSASNTTSSSSSSFLFRSVSAGGVPRSGGTSSSREGSISSAAASVSFAPQQVQIRSLDLQIRLELYLRTLFRVVKASTHPTTTTTSTTMTKTGSSRHSNNNNNDGYCVLAAEPPRALKARCQAIATAFSETVGTVRQQGPVLTQLLTSMTLEVLAVPCLSETCQTAIRRVVMEYEHATSFASLAFLSSPDDAAHGKLVPLLQSYFQTLQDDWRASVHDCLMEHVLQTVLDADMRRFFKRVEFRSIGHLLETCAQYRPLLQHIAVPPHRPFWNDDSDDTTTEDNPKALRQALNDLQRERITINGTLLPPVTSRSELIRILSQTLNQSIHQQPSVGGSPRKQQRGRSRHDPNRMRRSESAPTLFAPSSLASKGTSSSTLPPTRSVTVAERHKNDDHDHDDADDDLYLWGDQSSSSSLGGPDESPSIGTLDTQTSVASTSSCLDMSTLDRLTKRLLLAASRTGTGGDAYFIVRDLFGGKDVQVLASPDLPSSRTNHHRTLELWIQLTSLTIHCHTSFDVYPKPPQQQQLHGSNSTTTMTDYDPYSIADAGCEPLIQLHTTTTEVIALQQVRVPDEEPTSPPPTTTTPSTDTTTTSCTKTVLQERVTSQSGWKTLSIRPALYEKLSVWTTPS